jgi:hypothetical protein
MELNFHPYSNGEVQFFKSLIMLGKKNVRRELKEIENIKQKWKESERKGK